MKIVRSVRTHGNYFSLCRPIHRGGMSGGNVRGKCQDTFTDTVEQQTGLEKIIHRKIRREMVR